MYEQHDNYVHESHDGKVKKDPSVFFPQEISTQYVILDRWVNHLLLG